LAKITFILVGEDILFYKLFDKTYPAPHRPDNEGVPLPVPYHNILTNLILTSVSFGKELRSRAPRRKTGVLIPYPIRLLNHAGPKLSSYAAPYCIYVSEHCRYNALTPLLLAMCPQSITKHRVSCSGPPCWTSPLAFGLIGFMVLTVGYLQNSFHPISGGTEAF